VGGTAADSHGFPCAARYCNRSCVATHPVFHRSSRLLRRRLAASGPESSRAGAATPSRRRPQAVSPPCLGQVLVQPCPEPGRRVQHRLDQPSWLASAALSDNTAETVQRSSFGTTVVRPVFAAPHRCSPQVAYQPARYGAGPSRLLLRSPEALLADVSLVKGDVGLCAHLAC